jgi:proteasome component ECM29
MDDIKETVRTAGVGLSRSISSLTVRLGDARLTGENNARTTVNIVLPVLISKGVMSNISDVQRVALDIVMKLAKVSLD